MTEQNTPQAPPPLDRAKATASDQFDDLVGLEEIAISRVFQRSVNSLSEDPTQFLRAMVFIDLRRNSIKDRDAYAQAQAMRLGEVRTWFRDEKDQSPDDVADAEGKEQ